MPEPSSELQDVIILGSGCAGLTAAIYTGRANLNPLIIEGNQPGGQLTTTSEVENFPGFPEGIDGYMLMDNLRKQAIRFNATFTNDIIEEVVVEGDYKVLKSGTKSYKTRTLIIATGASPRLIGIPGEKEMFGGKGVTTCATCDGAFYRDMDVAVVGGGDSACEEALFLTRFCSKVYLVHRRDELRASKIMAKRTVEHPKIEMVWNTVPTEVIADDSGLVCGIKTKDTQTSKEGEIAIKGLFVAIGHIPNTDPVKNLLKTDDQGYLVPETGSQVLTNVPGVLVAGDCADHTYRQAITAAGMGCQAAIEVERWLAEQD